MWHSSGWVSHTARSISSVKPSPIGQALAFRHCLTSRHRPENDVALPTRPRSGSFRTNIPPWGTPDLYLSLATGTGWVVMLLLIQNCLGCHPVSYTHLTLPTSDLV